MFIIVLSSNRLTLDILVVINLQYTNLPVNLLSVPAVSGIVSSVH